jgi:uncharacterized membrane protein (UPF0127 family)
MIKQSARAAVMVSVFLLMAFPTARSAEQQTLEIASKTGVHVFSVELAVTDEERAHGLMFRRSVPESYGMLFDFKRDQEVQMWMKNTYVSLDMIFMNENRVVTAIAENRKPLSEDFITPCNIEYEKRAIAMDGREWDIDAFFDACEANFTKRENATKFVIELPAGSARKSRIAVGDKIIPMPAPAPKV